MSTPGIAPTIKGNPVAALIAQLNRFRARDHGRTFALVTLRNEPLPLSTSLSSIIAAEAVMLLVERLQAAAGRIDDPGTISERNRLQHVQQTSGELAYVTANLSNVTRTLALYGDALGLPPATYGITGNTWDALTWAGALSLAAIASFVAGFAALKLRRRAA